MKTPIIIILVAISAVIFTCIASLLYIVYIGWKLAKEHENDGMPESNSDSLTDPNKPYHDFIKGLKN